ncbi:hypothetical protein SAMN04488066_1164 [Halorubrum aquaticum]|uniref:Uncharacterized protein n=1 Tax=Halorubrum aquaticum TaxID=387340 RepID=A0A1I3BW65_9EURY|nr:hypothetical protein [Halorubrum aquaticum]SFH66537.1 hypothetical protein SAMN04488066_1164 [Halorubrum aquaticum]
MTQLTTAERIALYGGGGLLLIGTLGIGLLEIVAGAPHPVSGEGQIVHETLVPLSVRSSIMLLGLLLWGVYAASSVAREPPADTSI